MALGARKTSGWTLALVVGFNRKAELNGLFRKQQLVLAPSFQRGLMDLLRIGVKLDGEAHGIKRLLDLQRDVIQQWIGHGNQSLGHGAAAGIACKLRTLHGLVRNNDQARNARLEA